MNRLRVYVDPYRILSDKYYDSAIDLYCAQYSSVCRIHCCGEMRVYSAVGVSVFGCLIVLGSVGLNALTVIGEEIGRIGNICISPIENTEYDFTDMKDGRMLFKLE